MWGTSSVLPIFRILEVQIFTPKKFISGRGGEGVNLAENSQNLYIKKKNDMQLILIYYLEIGISVLHRLGYKNNIISFKKVLIKWVL